MFEEDNNRNKQTERTVLILFLPGISIMNLQVCLYIVSIHKIIHDYKHSHGSL